MGASRQNARFDCFFLNGGVGLKARFLLCNPKVSQGHQTDAPKGTQCCKVLHIAVVCRTLQTMTGRLTSVF